MPSAKLGAKVDRYSFLVRILHSLLHTGLARRTNIAIALIARNGQPNHGLNPAFGNHLFVLRWFNYKLRVNDLQTAAT